MPNTYNINTYCQEVLINADWDKSVWQAASTLAIEHVQPTSWDHAPATCARVLYDDENIYVIFKVEDQYVRAVATEYNGAVWEDSCVEFFFAPDNDNPTSYFNIEVNCCGTILLRHQSAPNENIRYLDPSDLKMIQVASSLSGPIDPEITEPVIWTMEYAIPFDILSKYGHIVKPGPGVSWRGNFYKCGDNTSHPHWMTWSPIETQTPDFHRPDSFGLLKFT